MADHMFAGLPSGNQNIWEIQEILWIWTFENFIQKIRILNQKGLLFIYCALLKPQLWFCMHMSSSCARIYRCIFTSSHIICIKKIHPIVNSAQDLLHMLWFYSFLVLKLFTTSADHELSFSKIIRINHSSCSLCSLLFFDLLPMKWSASATFNIDAECTTEKNCNLALTPLLLSHMTQWLFLHQVFS